MENKKKSEFNKVFSAWDILVIAFGAMIGWGWVVSTGDWINTGGVIGAMLGFVIGGVMIFFVGLTYAELTAALPQCGGEHVFSFRAMGPIGSYICTWAIVLGYVSVVCLRRARFLRSLHIFIRISCRGICIQWQDLTFTRHGLPLR